MRVLEVGREAVLVEVDGSHEALSLAAHLRGAAGGRLAQDIVPGASTVLVDGVDDLVRLRSLLDTWTPSPRTATGRVVEVVTTYDGADLAAVAEAWGSDTRAVAERHQAIDFVVAFCGFAPGFAYLSGLPPELAVARRATPRTRVPVGSVALAGEWCGVYPTASPGGWQLIGHTTAPLWDVAREQPALLAPGTHVRFVSR